MVIDDLAVKGNLNITLTDASGNVKQKAEVPNLVVSTGKALIVSRLVGTTSGVVSHMALGTGTTAPAVTQTALTTENGRVALTSSTITTTTVTNDSVEYVATFGAGVALGAITEAGLFNAALDGTMAARTTFGVVTKEANDILTINWKLTVL